MMRDSIGKLIDRKRTSAPSVDAFARGDLRQMTGVMAMVRQLKWQTYGGPSSLLAKASDGSLGL